MGCGTCITEQGPGRAGWHRAAAAPRMVPEHGLPFTGPAAVRTLLYPHSSCSGRGGRLLPLFYQKLTGVQGKTELDAPQATAHP